MHLFTDLLGKSTEYPYLSLEQLLKPTNIPWRSNQFWGGSTIESPVRWFEGEFRLARDGRDWKVIKDFDFEKA